MDMALDEKKQWAILQLQEKHRSLGRLPKKDDFDETDRARIKAFLGPWPRALEAAGLKEAKPKPPRPRKRKKAANTAGNHPEKERESFV